MFKLLLLLLFAICVNSQELITNYGYFITVGSHKNYVLYFKPLNNEVDEYMEGRVYIYDPKNRTNNKLSNKVYILDFIQCIWEKNQESFFISDGTSIERYSFKVNKKTSVYERKSDNELINYFSVSPNEYFVAVNVRTATNESHKQTTFILNLSNGEKRSVYDVADNSHGEQLYNKLMWSTMSKLFIQDLNGDLFQYSWSTSNLEKIESNIERLYFANSSHLYYTKKDQKNRILCRYSINEKTRFNLMDSPNVRIDYVGVYNNDVLISFDENILIYKKNKVEKLNLPNTGKYVYVNESIAVQEKNNSELYLYRF